MGQITVGSRFGSLTSANFLQIRFFGFFFIIYLPNRCALSSEELVSDSGNVIGFFSRQRGPS